MDHSKHNAAKFAFFYMLSLVALIFMALSTGMVIFQIINKYIVDIINQYQNFSQESLKFAISALIISAPIFYFVSRAIYKSLFRGELEKESGVRKWLIYFILLVSSVVMIGWLIGTINSFLDGDLTLKFILKSLTAISISAAIFSFYFYDVRREKIKGEKDRVISIYFYASLVVVLASFIMALVLVESPKETRKRKIDEAILNSFSRIDSNIYTFYEDNKRMPNDLEELRQERQSLLAKDIIDPESKVEFDYNLKSGKEYELCATFRTSNKDEDDYRRPWTEDGRLHDAGYQCLERKVRIDEKFLVD